MAPIVQIAEHRRKGGPAPVYFDRKELMVLLSLYSGRVARGEWRDYAIGHDPGMARFSVFRSSHERPLYTVTKRPAGGSTLYAVFEGDRKLRQSGRLREALKALDESPRLSLS